MQRATEKITKHWKTVEKLTDFSFIHQLTKTFPEAEIFLVGGAVRDILLDITNITDYDFVIRGIHTEKLESFLQEHGSVNLVGKTFGVYKFAPAHATLPEALDIALPRTETKRGIMGRYKDFSIETDPKISIEEDLSRRDFTINALAYNVHTATLYDPFQGITDLQNKIIDTVGIPKRRFAEDYSRLLRAIRFEVSFNFSITKRAAKQLKRLVPKLNEKISGGFIVPREVIAKELIKTFSAHPVRAFDAYDTYSIFTTLIPELNEMKGCPQPEAFHTEGDVWEHTRLALTKIGDGEFTKLFPGEPVTPLLIIATLFHDIGKPQTLETPEQDGTDRVRNNNHDNVGSKIAASICNRLKLSSYGPAHIDCTNLSWLIKKHLLLVHGPIEQIKNSTLEKYFYNDAVPGTTLRHLFYTDGAATIPKNGNNLTALKLLLARLSKLESKVIEKDKTKKPRLINGDDLQTELQLQPGPHMGRVLEELREAELSGVITNKKQALSLARKLQQS